MSTKSEGDPLVVGSHPMTKEKVHQAPSWEALSKESSQGSDRVRCVFLSLLITAIVREAGGVVDVSGQTLVEMGAELEAGTLVHAVPQSYTDRTHLRLHLPGRSETDDAGLTP